MRCGIDNRPRRASRARAAGALAAGVLRALSSTAIVTFVGLLVVGPASATEPACTVGDVRSLASGTIPVAKQVFRGRDTGSGNTWLCQFRLYDGNDDDDPEVPHVFTTRDWFLGGIFQWATQDDLAGLGGDRAAALAALDAIEDRLFWREQGGTWTELALVESSRRGVLAPWGEVLPLLQHRYHIFPAGSLAPGIYEWRWENFDVAYDPPLAVVFGVVQIVAD